MMSRKDFLNMEKSRAPSTRLPRKLVSQFALSAMTEIFKMLSNVFNKLLKKSMIKPLSKKAKNINSMSKRHYLRMTESFKRRRI